MFLDIELGILTEQVNGQMKDTSLQLNHHQLHLPQFMWIQIQLILH